MCGISAIFDKNSYDFKFINKNQNKILLRKFAENYKNKLKRHLNSSK